MVDLVKEGKALKAMAAKANEFNERVVAMPVPDRPTVLKGARLEYGVGFLMEEVAEFQEASNKGDVAGAADAMIDLVYVALGRLQEMGVPAGPVFDAVHAKNMQKRQGSVSTRPHSLGHDAVKPEGWTPPDHTWLEHLPPAVVEATKLLAKKAQDYRTGVSLAEYFPFGHESYAHMLHTKQLRIRSLLAARAQGREPNFEGIEDTLLDIINYAGFYYAAIKGGELSAGDKA